MSKKKISCGGFAIDNETIKEEDDTDYMALMQERFASNGGKIDSDILEWNRKRNEKI